MKDEDVYCYAGRCKCGCGGLVYACVDREEHRKDNAKDIAKQIRAGLIIERMTVAAFRLGPHGCQKAA